MAGFSDFLENEILDHVLRNESYTPPSTVYASLHTADPGEDGSNEVAGGSYARKVATFDAASGGQSVSNNNVVFNDMPAVTVTHLALWDAVSAGNCLFAGALTASKSLTAGESLTLAIGDLTVDLD